MLDKMSPTLHPTSETCNKSNSLHAFGEQGSPISTTKLLNGLDTAGHGLILRQRGATGYTELLEPYFGQYRAMFDRLLMGIKYLLGPRVSCSKNIKNT